MRPLIVTPTYHEADNIAEFLRARARGRARRRHPRRRRQQPRRHRRPRRASRGASSGRSTCCAGPRKIGLGDAYRAGFTVGIERGYDVLVQIDADLSHDPAALPPAPSSSTTAPTSSIGSRYVPGGSIPHWPWHRRALSKWGNRYATFVLGMPISDATSGYRAYRADDPQDRRLRHARGPRATASRSSSRTA